MDSKYTIKAEIIPGLQIESDGTRLIDAIEDIEILVSIIQEFRNRLAVDESELIKKKNEILDMIKEAIELKEEMRGKNE
jgi:hypothetical protein